MTLISTSTKSIKVSGGSETIEPNIVIRGNSRLGVGCDAGASVLSLGSIQIEGDVRHWGAEITAGGKVFISGSNTAYSEFEHSLTVHAGDDIILESSGTYGLCNADGQYHVVKIAPILVY